MDWFKSNWFALVVLMSVVAVAAYALMPMLTSLKEKCVFIVLEDKAVAKISGVEMTGPASYRSYVQGCGYPQEPVEAPVLEVPLP